MQKTINLNLRVTMKNKNEEKFNVIEGSDHPVDNTVFVVATRVGKPGFVRIAREGLKKV